MPAPKIGLVLLLCCTALNVAAQKKKAVFSDTSDYEFVFTKVETEAGTNVKDWHTYMRSSTALPPAVAKSIPPGTYNVLVKFVISAEGKIGDIKADNDPGYGLAARAVEVFKGYKGKWQPANQCGRFVKSYKTMPVTFVIPQ
ncbi:hypothetical protein HB364_00775 [Pseudoflavitalea sp. X16]|uniref:energy transducer TonB n=1 Tax=Paraflavitalea devenefica TaxID=2716334 RepID=UPI0014214EAC|nr:hypothetical protein [Paraflavitalea devenefica]NII23592.1 hypothetical protein [Paraflavitalea devenefica]